MNVVTFLYVVRALKLQGLENILVVTPSSPDGYIGLQPAYGAMRRCWTVITEWLMDTLTIDVSDITAINQSIVNI